MEKSRAAVQKNGSRFVTLTWVGSIVAIAAITVAVASSWLLYNYTITLLTDNLRERLLSISITEAANIDAAAIEELQIENDWTKPEWVDVVTRLKKAKDSNSDIVYMYIFRHHADDPTKMEFVADAESLNPYANTDGDPTNDVDANGDGTVEGDGADKLQWPGQDYPEAADIPETFEAYRGLPLTVADLYEDAYGRVLTGYAPIRDDAGNVVAILATDIRADDFFTVTRQTLYPFLVFIAGLITIISVLSATLIYIWRRRAIIQALLTEELSTVNRQQEGLLHFIGHEVKGYITKSEAAFSSIASGDYGQTSPELKKMSELALADMRKGAMTIGDILDASNLKKGTVTYNKEKFDLISEVEAVVNDLRPAAAEKNISLSFQKSVTGPSFVEGDKDKIGRHVIRNIVDNSIKYTPQGSIKIDVIRDGNIIRVIVTDTGVGITADDMKNLFTEGGHGKDSIRINVHSTGYGLFIAKEIVEAHGGKIWAESDGEGRGAKFIVELPAAQA